jgi:hypothetical protein
MMMMMMMMMIIIIIIIILQFLPYGRSIGSWVSYTQDVYMSHGTEYVHDESCNGLSLLL